MISTLEKWLPGKPLEAWLTGLNIPYWGIYVSIEERGYYRFIEFLIRKGAHFFHFSLLALAMYAVLPIRKYRMLGAAFLTLLVAISDEAHQSLTSGRTASTQDVMLDMAGAITALLLFRTIKRWKTKNPLKEF